MLSDYIMTELHLPIKSGLVSETHTIKFRMETLRIYKIDKMMSNFMDKQDDQLSFNDYKKYLLHN